MNIIQTVGLLALAVTLTVGVVLVVRMVLSTMREMKHGGGGFKE